MSEPLTILRSYLQDAQDGLGYATIREDRLETIIVDLQEMADEIVRLERRLQRCEEGHLG